MNIDACRVPISKEDIDMINAKSSKNPTTNYSDKDDKIYGKFSEDRASKANELGRFPSNIVIDEEIAKDIDKQTGITISTGGSGEASTKNRARYIYGKFNNETNEVYHNDSLGGYGDVGGGSRIFNIFKYNSKVSPQERSLPNGERNPHTTLKPKELIKWLIKLLTPIDGFTIDITAGSCTHAVSCEELNAENNYRLKYVDIEICNDEENPYCEVGKLRVESVINSVHRKKLF
jgi:site-specific DNA-methyltransferase (adenine-specific)